MKDERLIIIKETINSNLEGTDVERLSYLLGEGVVPDAEGTLDQRTAHYLAWAISAGEATYRSIHPGSDHSQRALSKPLV